MDAAMLDALEADSPALAGVLREQSATIDSLRETTEQLQARLAAEDAQRVKMEVQDAIDVTPKLAEWQNASDRTMWNEAERIDRVLRESPAWAGKPFQERFAKVVALTEASVETPRRQDESREQQEHAEAGLPADLENLSVTALAEHFQGKSVDEINFLISRMGT